MLIINATTDYVYKEFKTFFKVQFNSKLKKIYGTSFTHLYKIQTFHQVKIIAICEKL